MAQMHPEWLPDHDAIRRGTAAEHELYRLLHAAFGADVHVIAGRELVDPEKAEGRILEMDFLLLVPGRPALVLECKSDADRRLTPRRVAGFHQQLHNLHRGVGRALASLPGAPPELARGVATALAVPRASARSVTTAETGGLPGISNLVLGREHLGSPAQTRAALADAFSWWATSASAEGFVSPTPLSKSTIELIVRAHAPSWFGSPLRLLTAGAIGEQVVLTEQQHRALKYAERHPRVALVGGAGTGKTLVARRRALDLAAGGSRVLLLCHGRPLADWLARETAAADGAVDVRTFDEIEDGIARGDIRDEVDRRFLSLSPRTLATPKLNAYDAVIVDEAQDVATHRLARVERFLRQPDGGFVLLLWDDHQVLYREHAELPDGYLQVDLDQNLRNTRDIHRLARVFRTAGVWATPHPDGPAVALDLIDDSNTLVAEVDRVVAEARCDAHVTQGNIAVLIASGVDGMREQFRERQTLGGAPVVRDASDWAPDGDRVLIDSVRRFRGLEAEVVVLVGVEALLEEPLPWLDDILYVALTRARAWVSVVGTGAELDALLAELRRRDAEILPFRCAACGQLALRHETAMECHHCGARDVRPYALPLRETPAPGLRRDEVPDLLEILEAGPGRPGTTLVTRDPAVRDVERVLGVADGSPVLVWNARTLDLTKPLSVGIEMDVSAADALVDLLDRAKLTRRKSPDHPGRLTVSTGARGPGAAIAAHLAALLGGLIADARQVGARDCIAALPATDIHGAAFDATIAAVTAGTSDHRVAARGFSGGTVLGPFPVPDRRRDTRRDRGTVLLWLAVGSAVPARSPLADVPAPPATVTPAEQLTPPPSGS